MDGYTSLRQNLQTNMVFRSRRNEGGRPFGNASELWYPPASFVKRGRFNAEGQPTFYVANRLNAAVFELRPQIGDVFTVLAVGRKPPMREIICAHIGMERCLAAEVTIGASGRLLRNHPAMREVLGDNRLARKWLAIDNYLGDIATDECPHGLEMDFYKPTNALARMLGAIPGVDALQYPSVATGMNAVNLCMPPGKADELFSPAEAWIIRIEDHQTKLPGVPKDSRGYYGIRFTSRTGPIGADGELSWKPVGNGEAPIKFMGNPRFLAP